MLKLIQGCKNDYKCFFLFKIDSFQCHVTIVKIMFLCSYLILSVICNLILKPDNIKENYFTRSIPT